MPVRCFSFHGSPRRKHGVSTSMSRSTSRDRSSFFGVWFYDPTVNAVFYDANLFLPPSPPSILAPLSRPIILMLLRSIKRKLKPELRAIVPGVGLPFRTDVVRILLSRLRLIGGFKRPFGNCASIGERRTGGHQRALQNSVQNFIAAV